MDGVPASSPFLLQGEEELLYTLLSNLITNAVEASPDGARVVVDLSRTQHACIKITNNGAVPVEMRKDFFKKYKTHGKKRGTGLGTYSAKLIADTMGYSLRMDTSDTEDTTTVTITL